LDGTDSKQANKSSEVKPKQKRIQTWFVFLFLELVTSDEKKSNLYSCIYPPSGSKKRGRLQVNKVESGQDQRLSFFLQYV
jgi:hypothetical protein